MFKEGMYFFRVIAAKRKYLSAFLLEQGKSKGDKSLGYHSGREKRKPMFMWIFTIRYLDYSKTEID